MRKYGLRLRWLLLAAGAIISFQNCAGGFSGELSKEQLASLQASDVTSTTMPGTMITQTTSTTTTLAPTTTTSLPVVTTTTMIPVTTTTMSVTTTSLPVSTTMTTTTTSTSTTLAGLPSDASGKPTKSADSFVDSIGLNIHMGYPTYINVLDSIIKPALSELGVRHVRDGTIRTTAVATRLKDLYSSLGIRSTLIASPMDGTPVQIKEFIVNQLGVATVDAVEGVNEPDAAYFTSKYPSNWAQVTMDYQKSLYTEFKSTSSTSGITILGPSVTMYQNVAAIAGASAYVDASNIHPYPSGRNPGTKGWGNNVNGTVYGSLDFNMQNIGQALNKDRPVYVTETGYYNDVASTFRSGYNPATESMASVYMPRLFMFYFMKGVPRTITYELYDQNTGAADDAEGNYGLIRTDGSRKPAFNALKNMISILKDPGPAFTPGKLDYQISGSTNNVQTVAMQKRDGVFYLAVWIEAQNQNPDTGVLTPSAPQTVNLTFVRDFKSASIACPNDSVNFSSVAVSNRVAQMQAQDKLCILKLVP